MLKTEDVRGTAYRIDVRQGASEGKELAQGVE